MKTIWKYPLKTTDDQVVNMPVGAKILHLAVQGETPTLWALVEVDDFLDEESRVYESRRFRIFGTGHHISTWDNLAYVGSYQLGGGALVFHVFELDRPAGWPR
jgi:hypothetical protein